MFQQSGKIEPVITDRNTAAVDNTVEAEGKAIFLFKSVVALEKKPEETAPYVTQSDLGQPDSLHLELTSRPPRILAGTPTVVATFLIK